MESLDAVQFVKHNGIVAKTLIYMVKLWKKKQTSINVEWKKSRDSRARDYERNPAPCLSSLLDRANGLNKLPQISLEAK